MNERYKKLKKYLLSIKIRQFLITYFKSFLNFLIYMSIVFPAGAVLSKLFALPIIYIRYIIIAAALPGILKLGLDITGYIKSRALSLTALSGEISRKNKNIKDSLVNTFSLFRKKDRYKTPVAKVIIDRLLSETLKKTESIPRGGLSLNRTIFRALLLIALLSGSYLGALRSGFYRESLLRARASLFWDKNNYMEVVDGNKTAPLGEDISIKVNTNMTRPKIDIARLDEIYTREMKEVAPDEYSYILYEIREEISYRIKTAEGYKTNWYNIRVLSPPGLEDIEITYNYPEYTRLPAETVSDGNIQAYKGTIAEIKITSDKATKKATVIIDNKSHSMEKIAERTFRTDIVVSRDSQYKIILSGKIPGKGSSKNSGDSSDQSPKRRLVNNDLPLYRIDAIKDSPPEAALSYPDRDIKASPDAKIEVAGRIKDNLGIKTINIEYYIDVGGKSNEVRVKEFDIPVKENNFSYIWNIAKTDVLPGSIITYNITAYDANTLYGPGIGRSCRRQIEIEGFREKHKKILEEVEGFQKELLDMIEKSYELSSELQNEKYPAAEQKSKENKENLKNIIEKADSITKEMEKDAFTEERTRREFEGIEEILKNILNSKMASLDKSISSQNKNVAMKNSEKIEKELEKAANLTEEIAKREKMSDLYSSADDTMNSVQELADMLGEENPVPEDIINKARKIAKLIDELQNTIENMPHRLPDEFINKKSMKNLDFNTSQNNLRKLSEALKNGNYDRAREILKKLRKSLEAMTGQIRKAAGESYSDRKEKLSERTGSLSEKLQEIIQKQKKLIEDTKVLEDYVASKKTAWEKKRFEILKEKFREFKSTAGFRSQEADLEFSRGRLFQSPDILKNFLENSNNEFKINKTKEFLEELRKQPALSTILEQNKKESLSGLSKSEQELKSDTENIRNGLDTLSHISALFNPEIVENISSAAVYMGKASNELKIYEPTPSLDSQRRALAYLSMTDDAIQNFSNQLKSMPQNLNSSGGGRYRRPGNFPSPYLR